MKEEKGIPERALFEDGEWGSEVWKAESFSLAHGKECYGMQAEKADQGQGPEGV